MSGAARLSGTVLDKLATRKGGEPADALSFPVGSGDWLVSAPRDSHYLVSAQAVFLPIPSEGRAEFTPVLFNYQSYPESPAVLTLLLKTLVAAVSGQLNPDVNLVDTLNGDDLSFLGGFGYLLAAGLASVVQEAARTQGCRPVKWLGDGVMFHFSDSGRAIRSSLELIEQTERAISVPARIGINAGTVIAQEGDYFGRTVNIAARIADYARPREVLVSEDAKRSARIADVEFELIGDVPLKGVSNAVRLHKAIRA